MKQANIAIAIAMLFTLALLSLYYSQQNVLTPRGYESTKTEMVTLAGIRILIAAVVYDLNQYEHFDIMFDSFRDLCECGAKVDLTIYTSLEWPQAVINSLQGRMSCRHTDAHFNVSIIIKDPHWNVNIVRFHRAMFYENIDKYDLFIYTEDDLHIRPRHVIAYLDETLKLKQKLGDVAFTDYSIGFLRYERKRTDNFGHYHFEHVWDVESQASFAKKHMVPVHGIEEEEYFNGNTRFHQGMYMATKEQLIAWSLRPQCKFNDTSFYDDFLIRETVSSLHLFEMSGCNVTQLVPTRNYQDFLIHHMSDKYLRDKSWNSRSQRVENIASLFPPTNASLSSGGTILLIDDREGRGEE